MSDKEIDIVEDKETKEEEVTEKELKDEAVKEEIIEGDSKEEEGKKKEKFNEISAPCCCTAEKKITFFRSFLANIVDSAICLGVAYVFEFLFDIIIKSPAIGYMVTNKVSVLFIIFVIVSIIYTSVMESCFKGETLGKGLFNIKVIKK